MKRAAAIVLIVGSAAGASVAHATIHSHAAPAIHPGATPAIHLYHQESSIRAIHVTGGYRIVTTAGRQGAS